MMIALPRQVTCQRIMAAARQQAWSNPRHVLGLPARLGDEPQYTHHWDLTAIAGVLDQATALQWGRDELTAWDRDNLPHRFAIRRLGAGSDPVSDYVVADAGFDQLFDQLQHGGLGGATGVLVAGTHGRGTSVAWTITCPAPNPDCARATDLAADLDRAEAEALASDHDGLHHGGSSTAEVARTAEMTQ